MQEFVDSVFNKIDSQITVIDNQNYQEAEIIEKSINNLKTMIEV